MRVLRAVLFALLAAAAGIPALPAQEVPADPGPLPETAPADGEIADPELERLLESALIAAENGEWVEALGFLDAAEELDGSDPRIASYRRSILELKALDEAQDSWSDGKPAEVGRTDSDGEDGDAGGTAEPKFTLDRGERDRNRNPENTRDRFRTEAAFKFVAVDPEESEGHGVWGSAEEFFYAALRTDVRYWTKFFGRSLGFNFRTNGYSWIPGDPTILFSAIDAGINVRGFLLESMTSRMEVGIDFGVSLNSLFTVGGEVDRRAALYLGLWISDPVVYHLLGLETFENLVFGMGLRIYSSAADDLLERIVYRIDGEWRLRRWSYGMRLEWWDLGELTENSNLMSSSVYAEYHF